MSNIPKLDTATAKAIHATENTGGGYTVLEEDTYVLKLTKVTVAPKANVNGDHYWVWTFEVVSGETTGAKFAGKSIRTNTTIAENVYFVMKQMFDAFGVRPNVDTDTLLGKEIQAYASVRIQERGRNKGKETNDLQDFAPVGTKTGGDESWDDDEKATSEDDDF